VSTSDRRRKNKRKEEKRQEESCSCPAALGVPAFVRTEGGKGTGEGLQAGRLAEESRVIHRCEKAGFFLVSVGKVTRSRVRDAERTPGPNEGQTSSRLWAGRGLDTTSVPSKKVKEKGSREGQRKISGKTSETWTRS